MARVYAILIENGRMKITDTIDMSAGIVLNKKVGDDVLVGDILCTLYLKEGAEEIKQDLTNFYTFEEKR